MGDGDGLIINRAGLRVAIGVPTGPGSDEGFDHNELIGMIVLTVDSVRGRGYVWGIERDGTRIGRRTQHPPGSLTIE